MADDDDDDDDDDDLLLLKSLASCVEADFFMACDLLFRCHTISLQLFSFTPAGEDTIPRDSLSTFT
jgi:hypothetical protein